MIVYKIENLINGKIYVGRTVKKLNVRMSQHKNTTKTLIGRAIQKYGWENFRAEIIEECSSFEELVEREVYWIKIDKNSARIGAQQISSQNCNKRKSA